MIKDCPITAKVIFKKGNTVIFYGNRYEKDNCNLMVYNLRKMLLKRISDIQSIQMFDNRIMLGERMILEYRDGIMLKNDLVNYLGPMYNPHSLK